MLVEGRSVLLSAVGSTCRFAGNAAAAYSKTRAPTVSMISIAGNKIICTYVPCNICCKGPDFSLLLS